MKITVLGSGTNVPSIYRASPSILVSDEDFHVLMDTGPGTLRQLKKAGFALNQIHTIIYSHLHLDHTADMLPFIFSSKYNPDDQRTEPLKIIGPLGIKKLYQDLETAYGPQIVPEAFRIEWLELENSRFNDEKYTVVSAKTIHTDSSIAIKLTHNVSGVSVVYSGDTDVCDGIMELASGCDLLILECAFPENNKHIGHLIPSEAGMIAKKSSAKKVMLTHFYPACEDSDMLAAFKTEYRGEVLLAEDLLELTL